MDPPVDVFPSAPGGPFVVAAKRDAEIDFSLILPTYQEREHIVVLLETLESILRPQLGSRFELIVVDDDSPDGTWRLALEVAERNAAVRVVRRTTERGLASAIVRGWQVARGSVLGVMDTDLQHPPEVLGLLLREVGRGAELAAGSRNVVGGGVSNWSLWRRILSRGAQLLGLLVLPEVLSRLSDPMSGVFVVRRSALAGVPLDPLGYKILVEVVGRTQVRWIAEVPYVFRERAAGQSKVDTGVYLAYLKHLALLRLARSRKSPFLRYACVAMLTTALDMTLLYFLSERLGLGIGRSKILGAAVAQTLSFPLHEAWTFRDIRRPADRASQMRRWIAFTAVALVGIVGAVVALGLLVQFSALNRYVANLVGIAIFGGWTYLLHRQITWTEIPTGAPVAPISPSLPPPAIRRLLDEDSTIPPD